MPTPRHLRHPAPHPPHRHTTRAPTPTPQHTPPDRHAPPARHTRPLHTHLTTPYLLPFILYLYICTSHPPPTAHCDPILSSPLLPFRTHSPRPQHLTAILLHASPPLFRAPAAPPYAEKFALPPKASSNPPVEIFCSKGRRRLILNILPRRHRVDNSVSSSVHSEEKA